MGSRGFEVRFGPRHRIVVAGRSSGVKYFAHPEGPVSLLFEILRNGSEVSGHVTPILNEVVDPGGVNATPCQQRRPARGAYGLLNVSPF